MTAFWLGWNLFSSLLNTTIALLICSTRYLSWSMSHEKVHLVLSGIAPRLQGHECGEGTRDLLHVNAPA